MASKICLNRSRKTMTSASWKVIDLPLLMLESSDLKRERETQ